MLSPNIARFGTPLTTLDGRRFKGVLMPAKDSVPTNEFVGVRLLLRVRRDEPISGGVIIKDHQGRTLLLGEHDYVATAKTFRVFVMTGQYSWLRRGEMTDPVTGLKKAGAPIEQGPVWAALEILGSLSADGGTHMPTEKRRVITGAPVALGDQFDGKLVRRVTRIFSLWLLETE
jgi:hypothetical protein